MPAEKKNTQNTSPTEFSIKTHFLLFPIKMSDFERIRLVILGGAGVGKSCIVKRFLFKTYSDKYRATVEDLYNREYDLGSVTLKVCS